MRKLTQFIAGAAVVAALAFGTVTPAAAIDIWDDTGGSFSVPSPDEIRQARAARAQAAYKFRNELSKKMLTVPSSFFNGVTVLTGVELQKMWLYSAEAVDGASPEKLARMMERSTLNPPPGTTPQSFENYVLDAHDFATPIAADAATKEKKFRAAPTKASKFKKGLGGALGLAGGLTFAPFVGSAASGAISSWMGSDNLGQFCHFERNNVADNIFWTAMNLLTMNDCSGALETGTEYFEGEGQLAACLTPEHDPRVAGGTALCITLAYEVTHANSATQCWGMSGLGLSGWQIVRKSSATGGGWQPVGTSFSAWDSAMLYVPDCYRPKAAPYGTYSYTNASTPDRPVYGFKRQSDGFIVDMSEKPVDRDMVLACEVMLDDGRVLRSEGLSTPTETGQFSPPACPSIPEGATVSNVKVKDGNDVLYDEAATPEYTQWRGTYPECGEGACLLDLRLKSATGRGVSCFTEIPDCSEWFTDPAKTDKYQCTYGARDVAIEECTVYAGIFKPGRVEVGAPYSDPLTGEWSGTGNSPRADRDAMSAPLQNPANMRSCDGMNVKGFDPVGFVMRPIQCALEWAFVPRPLVVEVEMIGGEKAWENKPPKVIADAVSGFSLAPSVSGCSRSVTIFSGDFASTITPMNACPGSWGATAANVSRVATAAAMVVLVVVVVRRQIAGMIGYGAGQ